MSGESPIVDALPRQLELLKSYGYQVVTVSELLDMSPFTDVSPRTRSSPAWLALANEASGRAFGNSFSPADPLQAVNLRRSWKDPGRRRWQDRAPSRRASQEEPVVRSPQGKLQRRWRESRIRLRSGCSALCPRMSTPIALCRGVGPPTLCWPRSTRVLSAEQGCSQSAAERPVLEEGELVPQEAFELEETIAN